MTSMPPYSFMLVDDDDDPLMGPINSTLSLTVFDDFDGTVITCRDPNLVSGDQQITTAMVFGKYLDLYHIIVTTVCCSKHYSSTVCCYFSAYETRHV